MGRPRKNPDQGLPKRTYLRHGSFFFVHQDGHWENLGRNLDAARKRAAEYLTGGAPAGTMAWWLDKWIRTECKPRVKAGELAPRTLADYEKALVPLKAFFGAMPPASIKIKHVTQYIIAGRDAGRPVPANRERAALSSCMSWMVALGHAGLTVNPCRGARRNTETKRDRYITDEQFSKVFSLASAPVRAWMEMIYRTLQRPADVLKWTRASITEEQGRRVLSFRQSKTRALVKIEVTPQLQQAIDVMAAARTRESLYLICREDGEPYKFSGIDGMFRRHVEKAGIKGFGIYDLKSKGATDMYNNGVPLAEICTLCAHDSEKTTEIYIKVRNPKVMKPNERVISVSAPTGDGESQVEAKRSVG